MKFYTSDLHFDHLIQTVFLCKSAHAIVSDKKIGKDAFYWTEIGDFDDPTDLYKAQLVEGV